MERHCVAIAVFQKRFQQSRSSFQERSPNRGVPRLSARAPLDLPNWPAVPQTACILSELVVAS
jgi:hypothetical protein